MKAKKSLQILGKEIEPGVRSQILLPMPKLYDGSPLYSHVHVINGHKPGPTLCLIAALHGDELNGIEIIRTVLKSKQLNNLKNLNGTIIAAPIVNIYGFLYQQRYLMDRRDLNRSFPGSSTGSLAGRTANLFYNEIFQKSDFLIDFHTGSLHRSNLPQVRATLSLVAVSIPSKPGEELISKIIGPLADCNKSTPAQLSPITFTALIAASLSALVIFTSDVVPP